MTLAGKTAKRLRAIRDRNQPHSRNRSAERLAISIYASATTLYLNSPDSFAALFPDHSLMMASPAGISALQGSTKIHILQTLRSLPPERQHQPVHVTNADYYELIHSACQKIAASRITTQEAPTS